MKIEQVRETTNESNEKLELAQELLTKALGLAEDDPNRKKLEQDADNLMKEARQLTDSAKQQVSKFR